MMSDSYCTNSVDHNRAGILTNYQQDLSLTTTRRGNTLPLDALPDESVFLVRLDTVQASTAMVLKIGLPEISSEKAATVVERIRAIDKGLDLPRKILADILNISRTTLYDILNGKLREYRNEPRLNQIEKAFHLIQSKTQLPIGRSVTLVKINGVNLAEVLSSDEIDFGKVDTFARAINSRKERSRDHASGKSSNSTRYYLTPIAD